LVLKKIKNKIKAFIKGKNGKKSKKKDSVLLFCAHNDDHIIGAGGTIAKYAKEGIDVVTVVFSYGESTHPWLKDSEIIKTRVAESMKADNIIGGDKLYYFGLKEGKFLEEIKKKKIETKIKRFINIVRPIKIFTHSLDDFHPDHKAVYDTIIRIMDEIDYKCDMYSFDIWNPLNVRHRNKPKLVVDISKTFKQKIKAIKEHESQWMALATMIPAVYIRGLLNGLDKGVKYAEVFIKLR
jgi:N-acetylglucosamine malate deacetylase 1